MDRDLNDARTFTEVVEHGSFSAAARAAGVPVSTVSRRIARLEARLGVALLTRTTRELALTEAGQLFHDHTARAVAAVETAERLVQALGTTPKGRIRVTATRGVAGLIWPTIAEFLERHSEVQIELDAHERRVNLIEERYDLAIYTGALDDSSMIARKILEGAYGLYASPGYLARRGRPRTLRDLAQHDCVLAGVRGQRATWSLRQRRRAVHVAVRGRVSVNEVSLALQATLDGHGIGKLPVAMVGPDLRAGRLERVLPRMSEPIAAWIVYPATRALSAAMRALVDYLAARLPVLYAALKQPSASG